MGNAQGIKGISTHETSIDIPIVANNQNMKNSAGFVYPISIKPSQESLWQAMAFMLGAIR